MRLDDKRSPDQPLSKAAFIATRTLGIFMLAASVTCGVVGLLYWNRLSWPYRIVLEVIPVLFFGSREDVRKLFISYSQYKRDWQEQEAKAKDR